jgi:hypothetical protein
MKTLTQCLLSLNGDKQTAWIETRGAKVGAQVELKEDGQFWTVLEVHDTLDEEVVKQNERNFKSHRKGTDI